MRIICRTLLLALSAVCAAGVPAAAAEPAPAWSLWGASVPTSFVPGTASDGVFDTNFGHLASMPEYTYLATNVGGAATTGPITITDTLPVSLNLVGALAAANGKAVPCDVTGQAFSCTVTEPVQANDSVSVFVAVGVPLGAPPTVTNTLAISGGGALTADSTTSTTTISDVPASFGFLDGLAGLGASFTASDGSPVTQAGSHPFQFTVDTGFSTVNPGGENGFLYGTEPLKDVKVKLPEGVVVDPSATPVLCTESQLESLKGCPEASQVGLVTVLTNIDGPQRLYDALYNMVPPPGAPAALGFDAIFKTYVHLIGGVDTAGNYSLTADTNDILAKPTNPILAVRTQLWGSPTDPSHDSMRGSCADSRENQLVTFCPTAPSRKPFLTMPSKCSGPLSTSASADSWEHPGVFKSRTATTQDANGNPVGVSHCASLDFSPTISLQPDTTAADSPSGLNVDLRIPQTSDTGSLAEATLKKAIVDLPVGMTVNPSLADGLDACTAAQVGLGTAAPAGCSDASKVATVEITTPLLDHPLEGSVFLAKQNDNPFNTLLAGYIAVNDPASGVVIKLPGKIDADPFTGQLHATFDNNPQLPFSELKVNFFGGQRGALVTPPTCGHYAIISALSPWSAVDPDNPTAAETKTSTSSFDITTGPDGGPCPDLTDPARFTPGFSAGTVSPLAGSYSPFVLKLTRPPGQQEIKQVDATLPPGLTAKLAGIPRCAQADITPGLGGSTNCPAGSQVGTVTVGAGAGSTPFFLADQPVYLTDGYDGAPFGLAIDTHALAGPFDLGHVVVRTKLSIDPVTAQASGVSEPLPSIIQGIRLHIRSVTLKLDRSSFVLNPTSCAAQTVVGQITGGGASYADPADDTAKGVTARFQVGGCSDLSLSPKLAIALTGKGQTTDDKHPGLHATLSQPVGQANLKKVVVSLPLSLALDPDNANGLCEFADGSKVEPTCPKASIVGKVTARTPILDQPLTGPVYFVKNIRKDPKSGREIRTLPKLVIPLTGENGLRLNLVGTSNVVDNRLVTTFDNIPDAPVSDFTVDIDGGKSGILVVSGTDICKATQVADQQIDGQNGKNADADVYLQTPACALKVLSKKVGKSSVAIKIGGLSAGKVTVTGKGIKKTTKTISKSTVATITAKRTKGKPGKVTVSFDPTGPAKAHKTSK